MREFSPETCAVPYIIILCSQDLRSQLGQERDSIRHISLQKEIEAKDLQTRLEKSVRVSSGTRSPATNHVLDRGTGQDARGTRRC